MFIRRMIDIEDSMRKYFYARYVIPFFLLLGMLFAGNVFAQGLNFRLLTVNEGLSQNTVWSMAQDANDRIWIGTSDGLNRYDGYHVVAYYHDANDSLSLANNQITSLYVDKKKTVWAGTLVGLSRYNPQTDTFQNFVDSERPFQVLAMLDVAQSDTLFCATNLGLLFFDMQKECLYPYQPLENKVVNTLCQTENGLLVGTLSGLYHFSFLTGMCEKIEGEWADAPIASVIFDPDTKDYWMACQKEFIYCLDSHWRVKKKIRLDENVFHFTPANTIRLLKRHTDGTIWAATTEGLFSLTSEGGIGDSVLSISIRSLLIDNQGGLWVGTHYDGVKYYHPFAPTFRVWTSGQDARSLNDKIVSCIVEDPLTRNLWIGTNDGGVNYYDVRTGKFIYYRSGNLGKGLRSNNIKAILPDEEGNVYVGTHSGGLSYIHTKTGEVENFSIPGMEAENNSCYSLLDNGDNLYVGSMVGLMHFDKHSKRFTPCELVHDYPELSNILVWSLFRDSSNRLWIGTEKGLYVHQAGKPLRQLTETVGNSQTYITAYCIHEDVNKHIWVASTNGLFHYAPDMRQVAQYTIHDGLSNNCLYGILEDNARCLWLSTNKGLSCFDTDSKRFYNYTQKDGLSHNEFNVYGYCKGTDGTFYFGSLNGITYFSPFQFMENPFMPLPQIVGVSLRNRPVTYEQSEDLQIYWNEQKQPAGIRYSFDQRDLRLSFVVPNYLSNRRNVFAYRLKGYDNDWSYTDAQRVNYSNLPPGRYTFQLRAANNSGKWCEGVTEFSVRVAPMWYQTWYVRLFFVLCALGIAGWVVYYYLMRQKMKMQLQIQELKYRKDQEVNTEKVRFYMNMSHELRTPLTLILAPLENIMKRESLLSENMRNDLKYIYRNCQRLLHIIDQLLSFRKAEAGALPLQVEKTEVKEWTGQLFLLFRKQSERRHIDYLFNSDIQEGVLLPMDKKYVETMLVNLLSNSFKFTPEKGRIELSVWEKEDTFGFRVKDTGKGIPVSKIDKIFERFYQVNENEKGTGIGLSLVKCLVDRHHGEITVSSEVSKGTEFCISLPKRMEVYTQAEVAQQPSGTTSSALLPIELDMPSEEAEEMYQEEENDEADGAERSVILLVEDNVEMMAFLKKLLQGRYAILSASNGKEAIELLGEQKVDLLLSDVMMPEMDGIQLCKHIKRNIQTSHVPVILLSAKNSVDDQTMGLDVGADDYIGKPFSISVLKGKINNILKARERLRQYYSQTIDIDTAKMTSNELDNEFLSNCIRIIEENLSSDKFSTDKLAEILAMSRSNLYLKMNAICGETPGNFIRRIRLNKACRLLLEKRYTVSEIGFQTGFSSPSYFTAIFKKHVGMLPTEYIKAHENEEKN